MKSLKHLLPLVAAGAVLGGCVNTPTTKALITPIGAAGVYSFAPAQRKSPDEMKASREAEQRLARARK